MVDLRRERLRQTQRRMNGGLRGLILGCPDGGWNGLGEGPRDDSVGAQAERVAEPVDTPLDHDRIGEELGAFHGVP